MIPTIGLEASAGLRHLDMAQARLRRRETREWARADPALIEQLRMRLTALTRTLEWLEAI